MNFLASSSLPHATSSSGRRYTSLRGSSPRHVGFIPDGNRRWALSKGLQKQEGYAAGISPGILLMERCLEIGIEEATVYCFTQDNTRRPRAQKLAFTDAAVSFASEVAQRNVSLLVVGDEASTQFPAVLKPYRERRGSGMKVNLLVNYGWEWDLEGLKTGALRSSDISRLDLIVRWGGGRRLSGFLPVQSVYADFYVRDEYWPDFELQHFDSALSWFRRQDRTFGG